ncbi:hypothetical protein OSB04_027432 [Centaurea solstitialis]|uniref:Uncharacterized protein n=1 Tax=Centaurea solstitialis TaxID=347529 RepID=A0AA38SQV6_9ASTR|nr:hypothetical protein OSB04_027432 [Centaurea solstitialis]
MEVEDDVRREAAIASSACLNPKFSPSSDVSRARLSKFQELHKRRLQIKGKSKVKKKPKISRGKSSTASSSEADECKNEISCKTAKDATNSPSLDSHQNTISPMPKDVAPLKKPQKLHWGLDTKERWERKSNM